MICQPLIQTPVGSLLPAPLLGLSGQGGDLTFSGRLFSAAGPPHRGDLVVGQAAYFAGGQFAHLDGTDAGPVEMFQRQVGPSGHAANHAVATLVDHHGQQALVGRRAKHLGAQGGHFWLTVADIDALSERREAVIIASHGAAHGQVVFLLHVKAGPEKAKAQVTIIDEQ